MVNEPMRESISADMISYNLSSDHEKLNVAESHKAAWFDYCNEQQYLRLFAD